MSQKGIVGIFVLILVLVVTVAGGAYYFGRTTTKPQPTKTQQPAQTTPSPDPTANWKTYTNTEKNFSLKYPSDWNLKEDKSERNAFIILLEIKSPEKKFTVYEPPFSLYEVLVTTKSKKEETTISQEVDQIIQEPRSPGIVIDERKKIIVAGGDAERVTFRQDTGLEHVAVYTMNKDKIYAIVFTASFITAGLEKKFSEEFKTLTDQILSTFQFTQ